MDRAGPGWIAVTAVTSGSGMPQWENNLAARMIWPYHKDGSHPLAPPSRAAESPGNVNT